MKNILFRQLAFSAILFLILFPDPGGINAQVSVSKITDQEMLSGKKGMVYNLPRTLVHVDLWVSKTQQIPGPLAEYAGEYLGTDEVITKSNVIYTVDNAAIFVTPEADPQQVYLIENEGKSPGEIWISFGTSSSLMVLEKFDKTAGPTGFSSWDEHLFQSPDAAYLFKNYTECPRREVIDTLIRKVSIDTLVLEKMTFKRSMVDYTDKEKAQKAADKIRQCEQDKYNLLVGYQETAYSREAMEFMYNKLEEQRLEYLKLFTGVSVTETLKFHYQFYPEAGKEEQVYKLAALSKSGGMIAPDGQNDVKVTLQADVEIFKPVEPDAYQVVATGLVYRVPLAVQAVLTIQGREMDSKRLEISQFGTIRSLPPEFKRVEFNMATGALKSVVLE